MRFTLALVVASLVTLASCSFRDPYPFKNLPKGEAAVYSDSLFVVGKKILRSVRDARKATRRQPAANPPEAMLRLGARFIEASVRFAPQNATLWAMKGHADSLIGRYSQALGALCTSLQLSGIADPHETDIGTADAVVAASLRRIFNFEKTFGVDAIDFAEHLHHPDASFNCTSLDGIRANVTARACEALASLAMPVAVTFACEQGNAGQEPKETPIDYAPMPEPERHVLFASMIHQVNLSKAVGAEMHATLAQLVETEFLRYFENSDHESISDGNGGFFGWQINMLNEAFSRGFSQRFVLESGTGWEKLMHLDAFKMLRHFALEGARRLLGTHGSAVWEPAQLSCWGTYQRAGSTHFAHVHDDAAVSLAYYPQVPPGSGDIIFYDPRGYSPIEEFRYNPYKSIPPFVRQYRVTPYSGLMVLFPSYLAHQVAPTVGDGIRVSYSCNIDGDWSQVAHRNYKLKSPLLLHDN